MQPQEQISLQQLVFEFGLRMDQIPNIAPSKDIETLKANLEEFKKIIKGQYRKLVKQYHPDVAVDKKAAHEKLIRLNKLMKMVNSIKIQIREQPQFAMHVRFSFNSGTTTASSTNTYTHGNFW